MARLILFWHVTSNAIALGVLSLKHRQPSHESSKRFNTRLSILRGLITRGTAQQHDLHST